MVHNDWNLLSFHHSTKMYVGFVLRNCPWLSDLKYRGTDKSLARPGRKQATATKLWLLQATQKKNSGLFFPSNQVSAATMTSASDEKWWPFSCFFSRVGLRTYQHPCVCLMIFLFNPYPTAFPCGSGMVLHFYQQQESSTTKTVHKVINKGLKTYV